MPVFMHVSLFVWFSCMCLCSCVVKGCPKLVLRLAFERHYICPIRTECAWSKQGSSKVRVGSTCGVQSQLNRMWMMHVGFTMMQDGDRSTTELVVVGASSCCYGSVAS